jgi:uncharacterized membrane protein
VNDAVGGTHLRRAIAALAVIGAGIAGYLLYERYTGGRIACTTGGCETVQKSSYAKVAGVPVALIGLLGYAGLFATVWFRGELARVAAVAMSISALAFSAYLLVAQLALIHAVCIWCLGSDTVVLGIAVLVVADARRSAAASATPTRRRPAPSGAVHLRSTR